MRSDITITMIVRGARAAQSHWVSPSLQANELRLSGRL